MLGACQDSEAVVVPVAEADRFRTAPGSRHVVTVSVAAAPVPALLVAVTENVCWVPALSPVTVAEVPDTAIVPEPVTE